MTHTNVTKPRIGTLTGIALLAGSLALLSAGCGQKAGGADKSTALQATPVDVMPVTLGSISRTISVVGSLATLYNVNLSSNTTGRLTNVFVREGDFVHKGQIVAQIDPVQLQAAVQQDQANLLSAQVKLAQSKVQYTQSVTNNNVAVETAKSQLISAKATLAKTIEGEQSQAKLQAQDNLIQQQANFDNAKTNYQRQQQLYQQGAIAQSDLDNATNTYKTQLALLDNYKQALSIALQGGRVEDIQTQQQVVTQDQANLSNAKANLANIAVDQQAILANQAAVDQAKAQLAQANKQLSDTNIVSSIDGYVSQRSQDPGAIAQPGTTILQIVDLRTVYYEPTVSASDFQSLHPGQPVSVRVDAYPGKAYHGVVSAVFPSASTTTRQFSLRVTIPNPGLDLRPGMYARGAITTKEDANVVVVPFSALVPRDLGQGFDPNNSSNGVATGGTTLPAQSVFLVAQNKTAVAQPVGVGIVTPNSAEITSGLHPGDLLIVKGQSQIQPGDHVAPTTVGTQKTADAGNASSLQ